VAARWLIDGMNVIGSRPDQWWRHRERAMRELAARLAELAVASGEEIGVVFDGGVPKRPFEAPGIEVAFASGGRNAADDRIVAIVAEDSDPSSLRVVTSDKALVNRVRARGAEVEPAGAFRRRLDAQPRRCAHGRGINI
jgi:predicted RNA-binding protein with PIN domain